MLLNELKKTLRHFWLNRAYTAINLIGLGLGLAFALLALLFISEELNFDRFHVNSDRIVILEQHESPAGRDPFGSINTPLGLARSLREDFPEVETAASVLWWNAVLKIDEQSSNELLYYADNSFFDIFTFPAIAGDPKLALEDGSQLILTESGAERLFGGTDILGAPLQLQIGEEFQPVTVGAVIEDPPNTSTLSFELLISAERLHDFMPMRAFDAWQWVHPYTFALLAKGVSADDLNAVISDRLAEKHNFAERYGKGVLSYHAQPWPEFHLHANYSDGLLVPSRPEYIWGIGIVGFLILVVAAVNYTTISVAASSKRISEVGIRLVLGAGRSALRVRLLLESVLVTLLAVPIAFLIVELTMPFFQDIIKRQVEYSLSGGLLASLFAVVVLLGLSAGFYPTLLISRLNPVGILKGNEAPRGNRWLLNTLVVAQFSVAVALISGSFMIQKQIGYMIDEQLENQGEQVLSVYIPPSVRDQNELLADRLKIAMGELPGVEAVTATSNSLGWPWAWFGFEGEQQNYLSFYGNYVDAGFIPTYDLELLSGRNFQPGNTADKAQSVIVNEALVRSYGWKDPIGKTLPGSYSDFVVIGVVKDFHYASLHSEIEPLVLFQNARGFVEACMDVTNFGQMRNYLQLKLSPANLRVTMDQIEGTFESVSDGQPYKSVFLDDIVEGMYQSDMAVRNVMARASGLTVFIALLGVLGLASMRVSQRRRELTIRKVLGATLLDIQKMMAGEFSLLVIIASLVALPVTWWGLSQWLNGFAYHVNVDVLSYLLLSGAVVIVALLVVASQSLRASMINPAQILRDE